MTQLLSISMFLVMAVGFVLVALTVGWVVRPRNPNEDKLAIYECGEATFGEGWVQFDLRFYIVALFYLVFDVEVALLYPWAVVYRHLDNVLPALIVGAPFVLIVVVGFAYEWYAGSLDWVRGSGMGISKSVRGADGIDMAQLARRDPESIVDETRAVD